MWGWLVGLGIFFWILLLALFIAPLVFWILKIIRLFKSENTTGGIVVLICGLLLSPLIGLLIGLAFKEDKPEETEKDKYFWCGICNIKYKEELLGGETFHEGKICRSCLVKKQRGENITSPSQTSQAQAPIQNQIDPTHESNYRQWENEKNKGEKRILSRELGRKQRKKNSYLTQFILNLAVGQWLLPLITYLIYWITLKEQMKVQALNNPGAGLATEIPFKQFTKDFFKILTSETYAYGGHNIQVSLIWKLGIILTFLLPLALWIYNLVRFLSVNGEVKQLEAEIKELE
jgi:hypothetical protein